MLCEEIVDAAIGVYHVRGGEALLENLAAASATQIARALHAADGCVQVIHDESADAFIDDLGHGAAAKGDNRGTAGQGLDHDEAEGLGPVDRKEQRHGVAEKARFLPVSNLPDIFNQTTVDQRLDFRSEIVAADTVDLGRDLERYLSTLRDRDGAVDTFLGSDTAQEGEIAAGRIARPMQIE